MPRQGLRPGQLVPLSRLPATRFLLRLESLDERQLCQALDGVKDPRLSESAWSHAIARELWLLRWWALQRLSLTLNAKDSLVQPSPSRVNCFLPDHALVVHLLRRAVPFAALGIQTLCGARSDTRRRLCSAVSAVSSVLGLGSKLIALDRSCRAAVDDATSRQLLVLTGKRKTAALLGSQWKGRFVAATGRCALVISPTASRLYARSRQMRQQHSCTNVRAAFYCRTLTSRARTIRGMAGSVVDLESTLRRLHPSVIFVHRSQPSPRNVPFLFGFRQVECDDEGKTDAFAGFGTDPVFGWPGDYLV